MSSIPHTPRFTTVDTIAFLDSSPKHRDKLLNEIDSYIAKARSWDINSESESHSSFALPNLVHKTITSLKLSGLNQSVLFRGDCSVDKQSQLTQFLTHLNAFTSNKQHKIHQRIIAAQIILSSLGTASTPTCPHQSKFAQATSILFDKNTKIIGAKINQFALDKSLVTKVPFDQRSFHIFYYLLAACASDPKPEWKLHSTNPKDWVYLTNNNPNVNRIEKSDLSNHAHFLNALKVLGLSKKSQGFFSNILVAILQLGQIQFFEAKNPQTQQLETQIRNHDLVTCIAHLLGLSSSILESILLSHTGYLNMDKCTFVHTIDQAVAYTATLASSLYSLLFAWLVEFMNSRMVASSTSHASVTVLAFPGTQLNTPKTNADHSPGIWEFLANHLESELDKVSTNYLNQVHSQFVADTRVASSFNLSTPTAHFDPNAISSQFNAEIQADQLSLDVVRAFTSECSNTFVSNLFSFKASQASLSEPTPPTISTKKKSKESSPKLPSVLEDFETALQDLRMQVSIDTNTFFVYCGHLHACTQAIAPYIQPLLNSGLGMCTTKVPNHKVFARYTGLFTHHGLASDAVELRDRIGRLLQSIDAADAYVGAEYAWLTWRGMCTLEQNFKKYKDWKKMQKDNVGSNAYATSLNNNPHGNPASRNGPFRHSEIFDDGASFISEDDTYLSETNSIYDGFSIANGHQNRSGYMRGGLTGANTAFSESTNEISIAAGRTSFANNSSASNNDSSDGGRPTKFVKEKRPKSKSRKQWICFTWVITWWIPSFCLSICGGMKDRKVQQAWREKVALCFIILLLSLVVLFIIGIAGMIICPRKDWYSWNEIQFISQAKDAKKSLVSIYGNVYDLNQLALVLNSPTFHNRASFAPYAGTDITAMFQRHPSDPSVCPGISADPTVIVDEKNQNRTTGAGAFPFHDRRVKGQGVGEKIDAILSNRRFRVGVYAVTEDEVRNGWTWDPETQREFRFIVDKRVYDLTNYYLNYQLLNQPKQDFLNFNPSNDPNKVSLPQYIRTRASEGVVDLTNDERFMSAWNSNAPFRTCVMNLYSYGVVDDRNSWKCRYADYILLAMSIVLCAVILFKFLAALQLRGGQETPEKMDKFVIVQVPCYTEDEKSMARTINSIASLKYDDKRKLMVIICDGMIVGRGNDRPTPRIVLDILGVDPNLDPAPLSYQAIGEGSKQHNMCKVYSGLYEFEGHLVPYIVLVKVGKEQEMNRPGNRGKRDSQMMLMRFLNHLHYDKPMSPLELEMRHHVQNVIGVDPKWYEYCLMIDADTTVQEDSLTKLVAYCMTDTEIIGLCGETRIMNEKSTLTTMIQVYEYFISHHLAKAFESLFGTVTCLPGCFSLYRVISASKGKPMLCHDTIVNDYADVHVDTLHKKNLLHLGEDRYLTTLLLKNFPHFKTKFTSSAIAFTFAPESFEVLLSQRRRWINSTFHNLYELSTIQGLCGFCCFSMRFMVMIDLIATIIQPATVLYLGYLIYLTINAIINDQSLQIVQISLILIAAMYGLQAIVFILRKEFSHVVWMIIYVLALPVFSFFIPLYSFWRFDDFSWGNTRVILSEKGEKQVVHEEDEYFNLAQIKHMKWGEYQSEIMETQSVLSRMTADHDLAVSNNPMYRNSIGSRISMVDLAAAAVQSRRSTMDRPISTYSNASSAYHLPEMQQSYVSPPNGFPSDIELSNEIRRILMSADLMRLTKRQVRDELSALFQVDVSLRKEFINATIDSILQICIHIFYVLWFCYPFSSGDYYQYINTMGRLEMYQPEILAAFLCEFHAIQGPRIALAVSSGSPNAPIITSLESNPPVHTNGINSTNNTQHDYEMEDSDHLAELEQQKDHPVIAIPSHRSSLSIPTTPTHHSSFHLPFKQQFITEHKANTELRDPPLLSDLFDSISEYLIPKPALCGSLTSIAVNKYRMIGHPVLLEDSKYPRNVALWNVVIVVERGTDARGIHACVTKLAKSFKALELESEYVTNPQYRQSLYAVLSQIVHDLNTLREVRIALPHTNVVLEMNLAPITPVQVSKVHFWQVPVLLMDLSSVNTSNWDIAACRIIPLINGVRTISAIATHADMDSSLVRITVQHLIATDVVVLVDLFQFTNVYTPTSRIRQVANDPWLQHQCIQYILRPIHLDLATPLTGQNNSTGDLKYTGSTFQPPRMNKSTDNVLGVENECTHASVSMVDGVPVNSTGEITGTRLVSMYAGMRPGLTITEWINLIDFPVAVADVRRFVTFGVIKGWIRRVHAYPIEFSNSRLNSEADTNQVFVLDNNGGNGSVPKIPSTTKIISHHGHGGVLQTTHIHHYPEPVRTITPEYGYLSKVGGGSEMKSITLIPTSATNTTTIITSHNATTISKSVGAGMAGGGNTEHAVLSSPMGPLSWPILHTRSGAADFIHVTDDGNGCERAFGEELIPLDGMCVEYKKNEEQVKELFSGKRITWLSK